MCRKSMTAYDEEEFLALSGIQHFAFCRRQWALIHIEQQWQENLRTVEGGFLHEKTHEGFTEKRGDVIITRSMPVFSASLGVRGVCDVVELHRSPDGVPLIGREGRWLPIPVEYKRGGPKEGDADALQLCAQAMCLEDMLACVIPEGFLYYGETRRRLPVQLNDGLREKVRGMFLEMHEMFRRRHTPKVKTSSRCKACSLMDICLPAMCRNLSVADYIERRLGETD